jgi:hypothetical protein
MIAYFKRIYFKYNKALLKVFKIKKSFEDLPSFQANVLGSYTKILFKCFYLYCKIQLCNLGSSPTYQPII